MNARQISWTLLADAGAVAERLVERLSTAARRAIDDHDCFRLVLAGGRTPRAAYQRLARTDQDWERWEVFFGDERCLPLEHPERNSLMARQALLDRVTVPAERVHPIPAELGPEAGAGVYREVIDGRLPFDLVLLGMGEDGHTLSLFPGQAVDPAALVIPVRGAPKPPPERVSLGYAALAGAGQLLIVVTGEDKREAVRRWRAGEDLPVARAAGQAGAEVLIDQAAMPD